MEYDMVVGLRCYSRRSLLEAGGLSGRCAELVGIFGRRAYGLRAGSTDAGNRFSASTYHCWVLIKQLKSMGYTHYSLGGASHDETGLRKFKQELGAVENLQPNGYKIISFSGAFLNRVGQRIKTYQA